MISGIALSPSYRLAYSAYEPRGFAVVIDRYPVKVCKSVCRLIHLLAQQDRSQGTAIQDGRHTASLRCGLTVWFAGFTGITGGLALYARCDFFVVYRHPGLPHVKPVLLVRHFKWVLSRPATHTLSIQVYRRGSFFSCKSYASSL